jgi:rhodanese-related sulfurtransferase
LALALQHSGFSQVWPLKGGIAAWQKADMPTVQK